MNEMYEYLEEHNYISRNEHKNPFIQKELSKERAECIANKYNSLCDEKDRRIEKAIIFLKTAKELEYKTVIEILKGSDKE